MNQSIPVRKKQWPLTTPSDIVLPTTVSIGENMSDATVLLSAIEQGEPAAVEKLLDLVYGELRRLAG
jgi:hypothetical protein